MLQICKFLVAEVSLGAKLRVPTLVLQLEEQHVTSRKQYCVELYQLIIPSILLPDSH